MCRSNLMYDNHRSHGPKRVDTASKIIDRGNKVPYLIDRRDVLERMNKLVELEITELSSKLGQQMSLPTQFFFPRSLRTVIVFLSSG